LNAPKKMQDPGIMTEGGRTTKSDDKKSLAKNKEKVEVLRRAVRVRSDTAGEQKEEGAIETTNGGKERIN